MRTKLPVDNFVYLADFVYVKAREVWPGAVILDRRADVRFCRAEAGSTTGYGFDVFRSEDDVALLLSEDCCPPPPCVNVSWEDGVASVSGSVEIVKHIALQPLWSSS